MAQLREDILLNEDGDFPLQDTIVAGVHLPTPYGLSDGQHITSIIRFSPGHLKYAPTYGFGVFKYRNAEFDIQAVDRDLTIQMGKDGYSVKPGVVSPSIGGGYQINGELIER